MMSYASREDNLVVSDLTHLGREVSGEGAFCKTEVSPWGCWDRTGEAVGRREGAVVTTVAVTIVCCCWIELGVTGRGN